MTFADRSSPIPIGELTNGILPNPQVLLTLEPEALSPQQITTG